MHIQSIATHLNAELQPPDLDLEIQNVATITEATPSDLTVLSHLRDVSKLNQCQAGAILVPQELVKSDVSIPWLKVQNPDLAFARAIELFHSQARPVPKIHPTAVLGQDVVLGDNIFIGPYVTVGDRVKIGHNVVIHAHCTIGNDAQIGDDTLLHSHVAVRDQVRIEQRVILQNRVIVGADGFRYLPLPNGQHYKILQAGIVALKDDVEVQAGSAVDRATIGRTEVGQGTKIDSLVLVGHNCKIGQHTLLGGQSGLAGSINLGDQAVLSSKVGIADHLTIGDRVTTAFGTGIVQSLPNHAQVAGYTAIDQKLWRRLAAIFKQLPAILKRLRDLEQRLL